MPRRDIQRRPRSTVRAPESDQATSRPGVPKGTTANTASPARDGIPTALSDEALPIERRLVVRALGLAERLIESPRTMWFALGLAVFLRVVHLVFNARNPEVNTPILDHQAYDVMAQRIAAGDWLGHHAYWADPLYAYILAVVYVIVGHSTAVVRAMQLGWGVGTVALTGYLARRATGSKTVGHAAALMAAVYLPAIHYEAQLEKAALSTLLVTGALALLLHPHRRAPLAAGIVTGLSALARGNTLLLIPYGAAVLLTETLKPSGSGSTGDATVRQRRALTFSLAALAVVSVATVRNYAVSREFVPTTANFGQNLYIADLPSNPYGVYVAPEFIRPVPDHEEDDFRTEAERRTGQSAMGPRATSLYWAHEAVSEITADPGGALTRTLHKLRLAFHDFEVPDNDDVGLAAHYSPVLRLPVFWMGQLAPVALLGLMALWKRSREARVIAGAGAIYTVTLLVFFVIGRFRLPMVPVVIVFAAAGGAWLVERFRAWDFDAYRPRIAATVVVAFLTLWTTTWMTALGHHSLAVAYNNVAGQLVASGDIPGAIDAYAQAVRLDPEGVLGAARNLGELYRQRGDYTHAEEVMLVVVGYRPNRALVHAALVRLYERMLADPRTSADPTVRTRLIAAYRAAGRDDDAARLVSGSNVGAQTVAEFDPHETVQGMAEDAGLETAPGSHGGTDAGAGTTAEDTPPTHITLDATARQAMLDHLRMAPPRSPVWIDAREDDPVARARADEIAEVFRSAGWDVRRVGTTPVRVRAGLFLFLAGTDPPTYVNNAYAAMDLAHIRPTTNVGYRAYYDEVSRTRPGFQGFHLDPDQTWLLVVGRME